MAASPERAVVDGLSPPPSLHPSPSLPRLPQILFPRLLAGVWFGIDIVLFLKFFLFSTNVPGGPSACRESFRVFTFRTCYTKQQASHATYFQGKFRQGLLLQDYFPENIALQAEPCCSLIYKGPYLNDVYTEGGGG